MELDLMRKTRQKKFCIMSLIYTESEMFCGISLHLWQFAPTNQSQFLFMYFINHLNHSGFLLHDRYSRFTTFRTRLFHRLWLCIIKPSALVSGELLFCSRCSRGLNTVQCQKPSWKSHCQKWKAHSVSKQTCLLQQYKGSPARLSIRFYLAQLP